MKTDICQINLVLIKRVGDTLMYYMCVTSAKVQISKTQ